MQRTTVQRSTCGTGTITRYYQWRRRIWSRGNQETLKEGTGNSIFGSLERLWKQTQSMDSRNRIASCTRSDWRLLDKNFESKSIKEGSKIPILTIQSHQRNQMSYQTTNYLTALTSPNPYITRKLNNMNKARMMKNERND